MKRIFASIIILIFYYLSNILTVIANEIGSESENLLINIILSVLALVLSVYLGYVAFFLSQKICRSFRGTRYKVVFAFSLLVGISTATNMVMSVYPDSELIEMFLSFEKFITLVLSLLNPMLLFGCSIWYNYKSSYKKGFMT